MHLAMHADDVLTHWATAESSIARARAQQTGLKAPHLAVHPMTRRQSSAGRCVQGLHDPPSGIVAAQPGANM